MRIVITGTPGTGKSSVAKIVVQKTDCELIDIKKIEKATEVDVARLRKKILKVISNKKNFILEGHLACEFFVPCEYVFVLRTNPKTLLKRLGKRGYNKKKINENLVAEMLDYCSQKVWQNYGKKGTARIIEIETSGKTAGELTRRILLTVKNRNKNVNGDTVDYGKELKRYTKLRTRNTER